MTIQVDAEVKQLRTRGGSYINILRSLTDGGIGVWGHSYNHPTFLLVRGDNWLLVVFDDEAWRDEELTDLIRAWAAEQVYALPNMEQVPV